MELYKIEEKGGLYYVKVLWLNTISTIPWSYLYITNYSMASTVFEHAKSFPTHAEAQNWIDKNTPK